ncbi:MAG: hypothetical protein ACREFB_18035, partial [Stellaceae bacterium]
AVLLDDREGFAVALPVPDRSKAAEAWRALFEGARLRAERALGRPVTHAVVVAAPGADHAARERLAEAAAAAGLAVLRVAVPGELPQSDRPVLAAAILADDLAPRPPAEFA